MTMEPDVEVQNHGGIFLFHLFTDAAREWCGEHIPNDAQWFGGALAVEHRYAQDVAQGMLDDGLVVR